MMIWSSTYERALPTAKYIADLSSIEINISSIFNERRLGHSEEIKDEFWLTQLYDENAKKIGGGITKRKKERMLNELTKVLEQMNDGTSSIIVSHATSITFLLLN